LSYGPDLSGGKVAMRAIEAALPYNDGGRATIAQPAKLGGGASKSPHCAALQSSELGNGGGNVTELLARRKISGGSQNYFAAEARFRYEDKSESIVGARPFRHLIQPSVCHRSCTRACNARLSRPGAKVIRRANDSAMGTLQCCLTSVSPSALCSQPRCWS
jgi:hypothetical protein